MTDQPTVARLRELIEAATPGPWVLQPDGEGCAVVAGEPREYTGLDGNRHLRYPEIVCDNETYYPQAVSPQDQALICAAVNALPAMLAALEAAEAKLQAVEGGPIACHRTITGNGSAWSWLDGPPSLGALDNVRLHPTWRIEYARLAAIDAASPTPAEGEK